MSDSYAYLIIQYRDKHGKFETKCSTIINGVKEYNFDDSIDIVSIRVGHNDKEKDE